MALIVKRKSSSVDSLESRGLSGDLFIVDGGSQSFSIELFDGYTGSSCELVGDVLLLSGLVKELS